MSILEVDLEQSCRLLAEKHGCKLLKLQKVKGWPDRLLIAPAGRMFFMEFKKEGGGTVSAFQEHVLQQLRAMGYKAEVVACKADFQEYLERLLH